MIHKYDDKGSDVTYVFINGYKDNAKEQLRFEWEKSTDDLPVNRLFIIGQQVKWYHDCFDEIIPLVKKRTVGKRTYTIGASMGGYGALVIAHEVGCGSLTFSPQTNIHHSIIRFDPRWEASYSAINKMTPHPEWLDIQFIKGQQHHLYYPTMVPLDVWHAKRMDVKLFPEEFDSHNVAGRLKEQGRLKKILADRMNHE